jgi:hypothetical protein
MKNLRSIWILLGLLPCLSSFAYKPMDEKWFMARGEVRMGNILQEQGIMMQTLLPALQRCRSMGEGARENPIPVPVPADLIAILDPQQIIPPKLLYSACLFHEPIWERISPYEGPMNVEKQRGINPLENPLLAITEKDNHVISAKFLVQRLSLQNIYADRLAWAKEVYITTTPLGPVEKFGLQYAALVKAKYKCLSPLTTDFLTSSKYSTEAAFLFVQLTKNGERVVENPNKNVDSLYKYEAVAQVACILEKTLR